MSMVNTSQFEIISGYIFGGAGVGSFTVGLLLNSLTLPYFYQNRRNNLTSVLYLIIAATDLVVLFSSLPSAVSLLNDKRATLLENQVVCGMSGFVFNVSSRLSVFLIAVLSSARALQLVFPFSEVKPMSYFIIITVYFILNLILAALPLILGKSGYYYEPFLVRCSWGLGELGITLKSEAWYVVTYLTLILPWLLPGLVVVVACVVAVAVLLRSSSTRRHRLRGAVMAMRRLRYRAQDSSGTEDQEVTRKELTPEERLTIHATNTILIMTTTYIFFNVPCWLTYIYFLTTDFNPNTWTRHMDQDTIQFVLIWVETVSVMLNSAVNPVVYLCRMTPLRRKLKETGAAVLNRVMGCSRQDNDVVIRVISNVNCVNNVNSVNSARD